MRWDFDIVNDDTDSNTEHSITEMPTNTPETVETKTVVHPLRVEKKWSSKKKNCIAAVNYKEIYYKMKIKKLRATLRQKNKMIKNLKSQVDRCKEATDFADDVMSLDADFVNFIKIQINRKKRDQR